MTSLLQLLMSIWSYGFFLVPAYLALLFVFDSIFEFENRTLPALSQIALIVAAGLIAYYAVDMTSGPDENLAQSHYGPFDY